MHKLKPVFILLIGIVPIVIYYFCVFHYTPNIPVWDDYVNILAFLNNEDFQNTLFKQHNEHKTLWSRLIYLIYYKLIGNVNFTFLTIIGNIALIFITFIFLKIYPKNRISYLLFLPIPYLLFSFQQHNLMTWATGSIANFYCPLFALISIYFWHKRTTLSYFIACISAILATFTLGNGILCFFAIILYEIIYNSSVYIENRNLKKLKGSLSGILLTCLLTLLVMNFYFYNYTNPNQDPGLVFNPIYIFHYFFNLIGNVTFIIDPILPFIVGVLIITVFGIITYKRYFIKNPVIYNFILFLFLTSFALALSRAGLGMDQAFEPRYRIISLLLIISFYIAVTELFPAPFSRIKYTLTVILISIGFFLLSYKLEFRYLQMRQINLKEGMAEWKITGIKGLNYPDQTIATIVLNKAIKKGIYIP